MKGRPRIICLAGTFGSGKDTLAHYLYERYGFIHISSGQFVRDEAQKRYGSIERPVLQKVSAEMHDEMGADVLAKMCLDEYEREYPDTPGVVISGIRNLADTRYIRSRGGIVVFIDAPIEIRYDRIRSRQRNREEELSLEAFKASEAKELVTDPKDPAGYNLLHIKDESDIALSNDNDTKKFFAEATAALGL